MAKKKPYVRPDGLMEKKLTINGKRHVFRGRTEAGKRDVIYLDRLREVLEQYRGADEGFVFGGAAPMTHKAFRCLVERYHKQTGLTVTPHQLRHPYVKSTTKKYLFFLVPTIQLS